MNNSSLFPDWGGCRTYFRISRRYRRCRTEVGRSFQSCFLHRLMNRFGADIPLSSLPESTVFPHGITGIFVSHGAIIGENCTIFQQVTIGSNTIYDHPKNGAPHIGNNVYIGAGAKIIGNCRIGDNVRIGANCVVFNDIPDNATVVLERPRVICHEKRDNRFLSWGK